MKRLGIIVRLDNGGLGNESIEFVEHMRPEKVLCVVVGSYPQDITRFDDALWKRTTEGVPTDEDIREFLKDIDVVFSIETFYNKNVGTIAKEMGVKSILKINYEWLTTPVEQADLYVAPVDWHYSEVPDPKTLLALPVNVQKIPFKQRLTAHNFVHIAGHSGVYDRNGTQLFLEAISHVKSDVQFTIYSQFSVAVSDMRVNLVSEVPHYPELYSWGDVMVLPRKYAGQSMVMNEALAAGMPVFMTDMMPQKMILPTDWLIPIKSCSDVTIKQKIKTCDIDAVCLAKMIDDWADKDLTSSSKFARELAEKISWEILQPLWEKTLRE